MPYNWLPGIDVATPLGSPIAADDILSPSQSLCGTSNDPIFSWSPSNCDTSVLANVLQIAQPRDGDAFVLVTEGIPSATVRVLDENGEIGSGSGYVIGLNRPLVSGELISVVQELQGCSPPETGYVIVVL